MNFYSVFQGKNIKNQRKQKIKLKIINLFRYYLKKNICIKNNCIKCCNQTSMILSNKDIEKIHKAGYKINFFVRENKGYLKLKNINGRCVFHNGQFCMIYKYRPEGCKIYPLIYDIGLNCAIVDNLCPYRYEFKFKNEDNMKLLDLISKIKSEISNNKKYR